MDKKTGVKTMSAFKWMEFCEEQGMLQLVRESTRKEKILDLIFSNSPNTRSIQVETNVGFSDHGTVIMDYVVGDPGTNGESQTNQFLTTIPDYNLERMDTEQQQQLREKLGELLEEKEDKIEEMNATEL